MLIQSSSITVDAAKLILGNEEIQNIKILGHPKYLNTCNIYKA